MEKQRYYVSLNPTAMNNISPIRINDGQLVEYEISATPQEKMKLEQLIKSAKAHDVEFGGLFTFKHFNEDTRDQDKDDFQRSLNEVYKEIYRLGTEETKKKMEEIDLLND